MQREMSGVNILFKQGLPGFEDLKNFNLTKPYPDYPFFYFQSVDNQDVSLLAVNPFEFTNTYEFDLPTFAQELLEIDQLSDIAIYNVVNASGGIANATVNLQAPIVVNVHNKTGIQVLLNDHNLNLREPLKNLLQGTEAK